VKRQTGSHVILFKPGLRRPIVVPQHSRELPPGFIADLLRQANTSRDEFLKHV
jgi:predicted RNA binding protein YcfA (HicA-like mRNA interferase family)